MNSQQIYHKLNNKNFRSKLYTDSKSAVKELGYDVKNDTKVIIKQNTKNVLYVTFPYSDGEVIHENQLNEVSAAGTASTVSTVFGCLGSFSSM